MLTFKIDNTLCFTGGHEGLVNCAGSGQYLIWELLDPLAATSGNVRFSEIFVYNYRDFAQSGNTPVFHGLTNTNDWMGPNLLGNSNTVDDCGEANIDDKESFTVTITWAQAV